jgi:DNA-directed RNA polymerase subunit RPC12/RpoP
MAGYDYSPRLGVVSTGWRALAASRIVMVGWMVVGGCGRMGRLMGAELAAYIAAQEAAMQRSDRLSKGSGAPESFAEAEDLAFGAAQHRFEEALEEFQVAKFEQIAEEIRCPACGGDSWAKDGHDTRELMTRLGAMSVRRQRVRCRSCGRRFFPPG